MYRSTMFQCFMNLFLLHICYACYVATISSQQIQKVTKGVNQKLMWGFCSSLISNVQPVKKERKNRVTLLWLQIWTEQPAQQNPIFCLFVCLPWELSFPQLLRVFGQTIILRITKQQEGPRWAESTSASVWNLRCIAAKTHTEHSEPVCGCK